MPRMTEDEADALDDFFTNNTIMPSGKPGFFARQKGMLLAVDSISSAYLRSQAELTHQTPSEVIGDLVREKLAKSA
jgi:hypothetical protein